MSKQIVTKILKAAIQFGRPDVVKLCEDRKANAFLLTWQAVEWGILPEA